MLKGSVPRIGVLLVALLMCTACAADTATQSAVESSSSDFPGGDVEADSADTVAAPASSTTDPSPVVEAPSEDESLVVEAPSEDESLVVEAPSEDESLVVEAPSEDESLVVEAPSEDESLVVEAPSEHESSVVVEASAEHGSSSVVEPSPSTKEQSGASSGVSVFPPIGDGEGVARWTAEIIEWFPHDPGAFTQGLEVADGTMYESTGLWGQSSLRTVHPATGEVIVQVALSDDRFGEGLTVVGEQIIQLTWKSGTARVYDRSTLDLVGEHSYDGEGWGLCEMDGQLIMSDGSDRLARRDPQTFELLGTVTATAPGYDGRLDYLNELECVESLVIANVWQSDRLLVIDPGTGRVVAAVDGGPLVDDMSQNSPESEIDVLNGVAVDEKTATLWMTGKLWPRLYRVRIVEVP